MKKAPNSAFQVHLTISCKIFGFFIPGFLNANGSPLTRGQVANYGLMDQMAVLQWVQENGRQFGGDPQRVTLLGHGTGAACIEYLTHSPTTVPGKNFNCFTSKLTWLAVVYLPSLDFWQDS